MPAPYPYEAVNGRIGLDRRAQEIYAHYAWIARWSEEIGADAAINLKKVAQLWIHCRLYVQIVDAFGVKGADAIRNAFAIRNILWTTKAEMAADLTAIRDLALAARIAIRDTFPEAAAPARMIATDSDTALVEDVLTVAKPHAIETPIAALRAGFGAVPTA